MINKYFCFNEGVKLAMQINFISFITRKVSIIKNQTKLAQAGSRKLFRLTPSRNRAHQFEFFEFFLHC